MASSMDIPSLPPPAGVDDVVVKERGEGGGSILFVDSLMASSIDIGCVDVVVVVDVVDVDDAVDAVVDEEGGEEEKVSVFSAEDGPSLLTSEREVDGRNGTGGG